MRPKICPICNKPTCTHDMREIIHALSKKKKQTFFFCNCGAMHRKEEFSTCPKCGKRMCPSCTWQAGKHKGNYCWIPGRLKVKQIPWSDIYVVRDMDTGEVTTAICRR